MKVETLYRKYRPKTFSEIVNQEHVKKIFINSLENDYISHAYIFAGPRGTGKTTVARILAKSLNCENRKGVEPCNQCSACISIDKGNFMDVYEIDAASNRGIDEIRKIREVVAYHTAQGKYKVYIIDEVHMLTKEAFNALLKTLEEPPKNVIFILATTNPEKIPPTIISRCQVIDFKNIDLEKIVERLKYVSEKEGFKITDEALIEIAKRANGGLRDALTILEQVVRYSEGEVDINTIQNALGLVPVDEIEKLLNSVKKGNIQKVLNIIEEMYFSGKDIELFLNQCLDFIVSNIEMGKNDYIDFLKPISIILKDIKYSEEKLLLTKLGLIELTRNFLNEKTDDNLEDKKEHSENFENYNHQPLKNGDETFTNKSQNSSDDVVKDEEKEIIKKTNENIIDEIMKELKIKGDLSLYIGLSFAKILETNTEIVITFPPDKKIHFEIVKSKLEQLEKLYLNKAAIKKDFVVKIENETENSILTKLKTLFGNNMIIEE